MALEAKVRKWGDSLGIVLPKDFAEEESISPGDTVHFQFIKEADLSPFFGKCQHKKESTQKFKDELRATWKK